MCEPFFRTTTTETLGPVLDKPLHLGLLDVRQKGWGSDRTWDVPDHWWAQVPSIVREVIAEQQRDERFDLTPREINERLRQCLPRIVGEAVDAEISSLIDRAARRLAGRVD
jgi:hypothetical protein